MLSYLWGTSPAKDDEKLEDGWVELERSRLLASAAAAPSDAALSLEKSVLISSASAPSTSDAIPTGNSPMEEELSASKIFVTDNLYSSQRIERPEENNSNRLQTSSILYPPPQRSKGNSPGGMTALQYSMSVSIIAVVFLSWFTFQNWELLVGASVLTFWALILGLIVIAFPFYSMYLGKYALMIAFALGYVSNLYGFSSLWIVVFSLVILIAPANHFKTSSSSDTKEGSSQIRPNKWLNRVAKTMLVQLTGIGFDNVDLGVSSPSLSCLFMEDEKKRPHGFDMILQYAYNTDSNTHLAVRVPISVPGYGQATLPISVAAPCISGKTRLDGRFENCVFQAVAPERDGNGQIVAYRREERREKFFALGVAFDQIDKILLGEIQIMNAPKWEWVQSFETVKAQMKSLVNQCLVSDQIHVLLFDQSFTFIGTTKRIRLRSMDIPHADSTTTTTAVVDQQSHDDGWTVQDIVDEMKICYKCNTKYLPEFYGCCCDKIPDRFVIVDALDESIRKKQELENFFSSEDASSSLPETEEKKAMSSAPMQESIAACASTSSSNHTTMTPADAADPAVSAFWTSTAPDSSVLGNQVMLSDEEVSSDSSSASGEVDEDEENMVSSDSEASGELPSLTLSI